MSGEDTTEEFKFDPASAGFLLPARESLDTLSDALLLRLDAEFAETRDLRYPQPSTLPPPTHSLAMTDVSLCSQPQDAAVGMPSSVYTDIGDDSRAADGGSLMRNALLRANGTAVLDVIREDAKDYCPSMPQTPDRVPGFKWKGKKTKKIVKVFPEEEDCGEEQILKTRRIELLGTRLFSCSVCGKHWEWLGDDSYNDQRAEELMRKHKAKKCWRMSRLAVAHFRRGPIARDVETHGVLRENKRMFCYYCQRTLVKASKAKVQKHIESVEHMTMELGGLSKLCANRIWIKSRENVWCDLCKTEVSFEVADTVEAHIRSEGHFKRMAAAVSRP